MSLRLGSLEAWVETEREPKDATLMMSRFRSGDAARLLNRRDMVLYVAEEWGDGEVPNASPVVLKGEQAPASLCPPRLVEDERVDEACEA